MRAALDMHVEQFPPGTPLEVSGDLNPGLEPQGHVILTLEAGGLNGEEIRVLARQVLQDGVHAGHDCVVSRLGDLSLGGDVGRHFGAAATALWERSVADEAFPAVGAEFRDGLGVGVGRQARHIFAADGLRGSLDHVAQEVIGHATAAEGKESMVGGDYV